MTQLVYLSQTWGICENETVQIDIIIEIGLILQLGAFLAGALLAETNFRTQIEADIRPFRGLLLGLFFVTTGTSIDMQVLLFSNVINCPSFCCDIHSLPAHIYTCVFEFPIKQVETS